MLRDIKHDVDADVDEVGVAVVGVVFSSTKVSHKVQPQQDALRIHPKRHTRSDSRHHEEADAEGIRVEVAHACVTREEEVDEEAAREIAARAGVGVDEEDLVEDQNSLE